MARNLEEFSADLGNVINAASRTANTTAKTRALIHAAKSGDQAKVSRLAQSMTTAELKAVQKQLKR